MPAPNHWMNRRLKSKPAVARLIAMQISEELFDNMRSNKLCGSTIAFMTRPSAPIVKVATRVVNNVAETTNGLIRIFDKGLRALNFLINYYEVTI